MFIMILQTLHIMYKSGSSIMAQDNPNQSDYAILWWAISLEGIDQYFKFFAWRWSSMEGNTDTTSFGSVLPFSNEIAGFFGHQNL